MSFDVVAVVSRANVAQEIAAALADEEEFVIWLRLENPERAVEGETRDAHVLVRYIDQAQIGGLMHAALAANDENTHLNLTWTNTNVEIQPGLHRILEERYRIRLPQWLEELIEGTIEMCGALSGSAAATVGDMVEQYDRNFAPKPGDLEVDD